MRQTSRTAIWLFTILLLLPPFTAAQTFDKPRDVHYTFAHRAVPSLLFTKQTALIQAFDTRGQEFVDSLWDAVIKTSQEKGFPAVDRIGLLYSKELVDGMTVYLIGLPRPLAAGEAFYVAVTMKAEQPRYFTLEIAAPGSCASSTIMGEWQKAGGYRALSCRPGVDKQDFLKAVAQAVADKR